MNREVASGGQGGEEQPLTGMCCIQGQAPYWLHIERCIKSNDGG